MNLLFEWSFWLVIIVGYPCMHIVKQRYRLHMFGAISFIGICIVGGVNIAIVAFCLMTVLWLGAQLLSNQQNRSVYFIVLFLVVCLLTLHKFIATYPNIQGVFSRSGNLGHSIFSSLVVLGFSYSGLRAYDFIRAIHSGSRLLSPIELFGYLFPFHMLVAGPICLYDNYLRAPENNSATDYPEFVKAINCLTTGLFYKFVIAEAIRIVGWGVGSHVYTDSLFETAILFIYLFFDFAGYSMIALGIGYLYNIATPINFNKPFLSRSITDFWTRWHISLGDFVRKSIYLPLQVFLVRRFGVKHSGIISFISLIGTFSIVGLWHQPTINFLYWGGFLGGVMGVEKIFRDKKILAFFHENSSTPYLTNILGQLYVFVVITASLHLVMNDVF